MHAVRRCVRSALAAVACLMLLAPAASAACADADATAPARASAARGCPPQIMATVCLVNEQRAAHGARPVTLNVTLMRIAYGACGRHAREALLLPHRQ